MNNFKDHLDRCSIYRLQAYMAAFTVFLYLITNWYFA